MSVNINTVGNGKVCLIAGGDKIYTDIAARFVRSERSLEEIIASEYDANIVKNILDGGHMAATEFDYFLFGIEGYARVTEVQLVRKRLASYLIKSGRPDKGGKRSFDMVIPDSIIDNKASVTISTDNVSILIPNSDGDGIYKNIRSFLPSYAIDPMNLKLDIYTYDILNIIESWYNNGIETGIPEEELRYMKPQATEFKAIIGMNARALIDWFKIRTCCNAQTEIRDLARKMMALCEETAPDLFKDAGPNCVALGYCPENKYQNKSCVGKIPTKEEALAIVKEYYKGL